MPPIPRQTSLRVILNAAFALAAAAPASALLVQDYAAAVNERFASGFSAAPVANAAPEFVLAGYDLSGVGWRTDNAAFAVTMISPEHFLTAAHVTPGAGGSVSFLGADGVKRSYTVATVTTLQYNGRATDLALGRLSAAVDTAQITFYNGLHLGGDPVAYQSLPVAVYGANGRVGVNAIEEVGNYDLLPFSTGPGVPSGDGQVDSVIGYTVFDATAGEAPGQTQAQGGDSGSPSFARIAGGELALFGVHSAVATAANLTTQFTVDSLPTLSAYAQINSAVQAAGYAGWQLYTGGVVSGAIPEPATAAGLLGVAGLGLAFGRRRRRAERAEGLKG